MRSSDTEIDVDATLKPKVNVFASPMNITYTPTYMRVRIKYYYMRDPTLTLRALDTMLSAPVSECRITDIIHKDSSSLSRS
jgi:hypothetical protein